jgi:hypothetical protein
LWACRSGSDRDHRADGGDAFHLGNNWLVVELDDAKGRFAEV